MTNQDIVQQRKKNNLLLGLVLVAFVVLVFAITVAKMMNGQSMEAADHVYRPSLDKTE